MKPSFPGYREPLLSLPPVHPKSVVQYFDNAGAAIKMAVLVARRAFEHSRLAR